MRDSLYYNACYIAWAFLILLLLGAVLGLSLWAWGGLPLPTGTTGGPTGPDLQLPGATLPGTLPTTTVATPIVLPTTPPLRKITPTPGASASSGTPLATTVAGASPDAQAVAQRVLELINRDRAAAGLPPVQVDPLASQVAQAHAEDMLARNYFSHWNPEGYGPDHRYGLAGGTDFVQENLYEFSLSQGGTPVPLTDWESAIAQAQQALLDSPSHRANILDAAHTHVGIGFAYEPAKGEFRLVQEFTNHYIDLAPIASPAVVGTPVQVEGRLVGGAIGPIINLEFEPLPAPKSLSELAASGAYEPQGEFVDAIAPATSGDTFSAPLALNFNGQPGLYHIRIWVTVNNNSTPAADVVIEVQ